MAAPTKVKAAPRDIVTAERRRMELHEYYKNEEKILVTVSPMYRPYFGSVMTVAINGIVIYVPIDGSAHKIPATFAGEVLRRQRAVDAITTKQKQLSNVAGNHESAPGELRLF